MSKPKLKAKEKCTCGNDIDQQMAGNNITHLLVQNFYFYIPCLKCGEFVEVDVVVDNDPSNE